MRSPLTLGSWVGISAALALAASVCVRWRVAELADWSIDEAANLWLGSLIRSGSRVPFGLMSSRGIWNLPGVPLWAVPFTALSDLVAVSRALSLVHLGALTGLALVLWRAGAALSIALPVLVFFPGLLLAAGTLWNQYLLVPLVALASALLLLAARDGGSRLGRSTALVACWACALTLPLTHLIGFFDAAALFLLMIGLVTLRWRTFHSGIVSVGVIAMTLGACPLFEPWLIATVGAQRTAVGALVALAVAVLVVLVGRRVTERWAASQGAAWLLFALVCVSLVVVAVLPFLGTQIGVRLLVFGQPVGWVLAGAQCGMVLGFAPQVRTLLVACRRGISAGALLGQQFTDGRGAALLLLYAAFACVARAIVAPDVRPDLFLSITPALLCPLLLLNPPSRSFGAVWTGMSVGCALAAFVWLGTTGLSEEANRGYRPMYVPPREMRETVDWIAERHRATSSDNRIDVGYDLGAGLEWVTDLLCRPEASWYSIGRPYDWLFMRRHTLTNIREGQCSRLGGTAWQIGYRGEASRRQGATVMQTFDHVEVRFRP